MPHEISLKLNRRDLSILLDASAMVIATLQKATSEGRAAPNTAAYLRLLDAARCKLLRAFPASEAERTPVRGAERTPVRGAERIPVRESEPHP